MYNNIYGFINKELGELDSRIVANGKLNMQETQYVDLLAHLEKSLLTCDAMKKADQDSWYSDGYNGRGRNARRDSMGRYAEGYEGSYQHNSSMLSELHKLMENAPNEQTKHKMEEFISEIERIG